MIRRFSDCDCSSSNLNDCINSIEAYYFLAVVCSLLLAFGVFEVAKAIYDWYNQYIMQQVAIVVKGLPAYETMVDGRMCMLNDTAPYLFENSHFPTDPCTFHQISSACCNHTQCDASQFMYCHTYHSSGNSGTQSHTECWYYGMACYTSDEYERNHSYDYVWLCIGIFLFIIQLSILILRLFKNVINRRENPYTCISSDDCNEITLTTATPSAPPLYNIELVEQQHDHVRGSCDDHSYGVQYGSTTTYL